MLPTKFRFIWQSGCRGQDFLEIDQSETRIACGGRSRRNEQSSQRLPTKFRWQPCLLTDRDEMSNLHRGHSIDASYQVSIHLAKRFQRRRFFQKSTNQKQELPLAAMFVNGSELNYQSLERTFHRCFLSSFTSFGCRISEKIKM